VVFIPTPVSMLLGGEKFAVRFQMNTGIFILPL
jgi:hypothetical protein